VIGEGSTEVEMKKANHFADGTLATMPWEI
jgi:hypothetical protein